MQKDNWSKIEKITKLINNLRHVNAENVIKNEALELSSRNFHYT
jgi:hypothetical protein